MNYDDHCRGIGRLWGHLQSLEATLRFFLTQANPSENYITKWASLRTLVNKYNGQLSTAEQSLYSVDPSIVVIRNAMAHGRVSGQYPVEPFPLILSDDAIGEVDMTMEWFDDQRTLVRKQIDRISACGKERWQSPWWG